MCKRAGVLIGWDYGKKRAVVARATCDSWDCAECAERMRQNWKIRAAIGVTRMLDTNDFVDFVTITSHEKLATFAQTEYVWRSAWSTLYAYLKRRRKDLQYMIIPEKHKNGRMHVHLIWNAGITQRALKDEGRARGFGYKVKVDGLRSAHDAIFYVAKYLSKQLGNDVPEHFRRVRVSRNWPEIPKPDNADSSLKWEFTRSESVVLAWMHECQEKNISMIDQKTKVAFDLDDIDFNMIS